MRECLEAAMAQASWNIRTSPPWRKSPAGSAGAFREESLATPFADAPTSHYVEGAVVGERRPLADVSLLAFPRLTGSATFSIV